MLALLGGLLENLGKREDEDEANVRLSWRRFVGQLRAGLKSLLPCGVDADSGRRKYGEDWLPPL